MGGRLVFFFSWRVTLRSLDISKSGIAIPLTDTILLRRPMLE
jgi:hypothetical protein